MLIKNNLEKTTKNKSGIYKISSNIDDRVYIGSSVNLYNRLKTHSLDLIKNKHDNKHLQNFTNKYSIDSLFFEVISFCPPEYLIKLEQWFINNTINKFNIRKKAESNLGLKTSDATKEKLRKINTGRKLTDEQKKKISESSKGRKTSPEVIKKIADKRRGSKRNPLAIEKTRLANLGSKRTEEQKRNISNSLKGKKLSDEHKQKISKQFKNSILSKEHKQKISESHKNNIKNIEKQRNRQQGEGGNFAKLKDDDIRFIRKSLLEKTHTVKELTEIFNVKQITILSIEKHKTWKHVV